MHDFLSSAVGGWLCVSVLGGAFAEPPPAVRLPDGSVIQVELARTPKERTKGLSGRQSLPDDHGMLFVFVRNAFHSFTMNGMQFDLDLIFLDSEGHILTLIPSVPHDGSDTQRFGARGKYVLEVPAGTSERHNLAVGDQLMLPQ
jgi:uncharacterized membrane protein (UPF0127 family)